MDKQRQMIDVIEREVEYTRSSLGKDHLAPWVIDAMGRVPRELFVPDELRPYAYDDSPLRIGHGQTISQPYIVAIMTDLLSLNEEDVVLEVGTGSGYQAAVLSLLVKQVYTIETVAPLYHDAKARLARLGYHNVECLHGNGYHGCEEHAPFDAIIVTAAAPTIPEALKEQLKPGGRMMIPVGLPYMHQELMLLTKRADGECDIVPILGVAFVPLVDKV